MPISEPQFNIHHWRIFVTLESGQAGYKCTTVCSTVPLGFVCSISFPSFSSSFAILNSDNLILNEKFLSGLWRPDLGVFFPMAECRGLLQGTFCCFDFKMHSRISMRGCVRPSVRWSVVPSVRHFSPSVGRSFGPSYMSEFK